MSRRDLIDPEAMVPLAGLLEALPGGFNAIPDIVQRRANRRGDALRHRGAGQPRT